MMRNTEDDFWDSDDFWENDAKEKEKRDSEESVEDAWFLEFFETDISESPQKKKFRSSKIPSGQGKGMFLRLAKIAAALLCICVLVKIGQAFLTPEAPSVPQPLPGNTPITDSEAKDPADLIPSPEVQKPEEQKPQNQSAGRYRYFGQKLNSDQKKCYEILREGIQNYGAEIAGIKLKDPEELASIMQALYFDYPEFFWYSGAYSCTYYTYDDYVDLTVAPDYRWSQQESMQNKAYVESVTQDILANLEGKSDYEKVKGVYDFLIDRTAYDYAYMGKTLYELFYYNGAVCEGYAKAGQYLLNRLGMETIFVTGSGVTPKGTESHSWFIVNVEGEYYQVDITWGDPYFEDGTQTKNYNYLCLTDEEMQRNHITDWTQYPSCTATRFNYYVVEGRCLNAYSADIIGTWASESAAAGIPVAFKCANQAVYRETMDRLFGQGDIHSILSNIFGSSGTVYYSNDDNMYTISFEW